MDPWLSAGEGGGVRDTIERPAGRRTPNGQGAEGCLRWDDNIYASGRMFSYKTWRALRVLFLTDWLFIFTVCSDGDWRNKLFQSADRVWWRSVRTKSKPLAQRNWWPCGAIIYRTHTRRGGNVWMSLHLKTDDVIYIALFSLRFRLKVLSTQRGPEHD